MGQEKDTTVHSNRKEIMSKFADQFELVDCPEQTIKCADCNKPLMHYKVTIPNAPIAHKIKATCPFCKSASFYHEIKGDMVVGPIGKDESSTPTVINDIETLDDGTSIFQIIKGQK